LERSRGTKRRRNVNGQWGGYVLQQRSTAWPPEEECVKKKAGDLEKGFVDQLVGRGGGSPEKKKKKRAA